jgi:drug/metabolite transporter (DMT)-like permease
MTARRAAFAAIVAAVLLWGFSFISIKVSLAVLPPMSLGAVRFAIAVVVLWFVKRRTAPGERLAGADLPYLAGAGLIGVTAYFFFENNGVSLVSASEASIIIAAIPIITLMAEWAAGRLRGAAPRLGKRRWAGAALSVAGVWLVAGATVAISGSGAGYLFMSGAAASWVAYCFLTRPLFDRRSRIYIVFWQSVFGFAGFLPFVAAEIPRWGVLTWPVAAHVAYLGIGCSAIGYLLYSRALSVLGVAVSTVFVNLIPVVTVAAGFFALGDRLTPVQWLGATAVLAGVMLATWESGPRRAA